MKTFQKVFVDLGEGNEIASGNIYIRQNLLARAGDKLNGHQHEFDHTTLFMSGEFELTARKDGVVIAQEKIIAPDIRLILASVVHEIVALVDDSAFWCVYSHRDAQGNVIQTCEGYTAAYR